MKSWMSALVSDKVLALGTHDQPKDFDNCKTRETPFIFSLLSNIDARWNSQSKTKVYVTPPHIGERESSNGYTEGRVIYQFVSPKYLFLFQILTPHFLQLVDHELSPPPHNLKSLALVLDDLLSKHRRMVITSNAWATLLFEHQKNSNSHADATVTHGTMVNLRY